MKVYVIYYYMEPWSENDDGEWVVRKVVDTKEKAKAEGSEDRYGWSWKYEEWEVE